MENSTLDSNAISTTKLGDVGFNSSSGNLEGSLRFESKWIIWKNVFIMSFAFMFLFTSFQSLSNLQSSLYGEGDNMGTVGLAIIYGALIVSCLFIPPPLISVLGCKWTVCVSMMCYLAFMLAHFYAVPGTVYTASIILGLGAAPLWSAKCTYLTEIAHHYAEIVGMSADGAVNTFFGVFFLLFQSSQIWGNLISSFILQTGNFDYSPLEESDLRMCGRGFGPGVNSSNPNLERVENAKLYTLAGIYSACAFVAVLIIAFFLDQLPSEFEKGSPKRCISGQCFKECQMSPKLLAATVSHYIHNWRQIVLTPLTIYSGLEQAFMTSDFTRAFISCPFSISMVGLVMICYGVVDATCSFAFGRMVEYVGRIPFFILGAVLNYCLLVTYLTLDLSQDSLAPYFVFAGLWGMADAIWQTQLNAFYGVLFVKNTEAAFANYRLWESVGFLFAFIYSGYLDVPVKIYILIVFLTLGIVGYGVIEFIDRRDSSDSFNPGKK